MASSDRIIEGFPHSTITPILGQPYFETISPLKILLSTNTVSVIGQLGIGQLGLLWLTFSNIIYDTLSLVPFVAPLNPGPLPVIPPDLTQFQITAITETHKREAALFKELDNTDKTLK